MTDKRSAGASRARRGEIDGRLAARTRSRYGWTWDRIGAELALWEGRDVPYLGVSVRYAAIKRGGYDPVIDKWRHVTARLRPDEYAVIEELARRDNLSVAGLVRLCLVDVVADERERSAAREPPPTPEKRVSDRPLHGKEAV